jgi:hypothetical protein
MVSFTCPASNPVPTTWATPGGGQCRIGQGGVAVGGDGTVGAFQQHDVQIGDGHLQTAEAADELDQAKIKRDRAAGDVQGVHDRMIERRVGG